MGDKMNLVSNLLKKAGDQNKQKLWIILIIGAILLLAAGWGGNSNNKEKTADLSSSFLGEQEYFDQLETRLEQILQKVEGAGKVTVLLTPSSRGKIEIAQDQKSNVTETGQTQESSVALMGGDAPVVLEEYYPKVGGAVIVATGAGKESVNTALRRAAQAALQIGINRIEVLEGSGKR